MTLFDTPGKAIITYADAIEVGLITIATHGRSGLGRVLFGSVADSVLKESRVPILIIRPQHAKG